MPGRINQTSDVLHDELPLARAVQSRTQHVPRVSNPTGSPPLLLQLLNARLDVRRRESREGHLADHGHELDTNGGFVGEPGSSADTHSRVIEPLVEKLPKRLALIWERETLLHIPERLREFARDLATRPTVHRLPLPLSLSPTEVDAGDPAAIRTLRDAALSPSTSARAHFVLLLLFENPRPALQRAMSRSSIFEPLGRCR
jgi:hypothetical protein